MGLRADPLLRLPPSPAFSATSNSLSAREVPRGPGPERVRVRTAQRRPLDQTSAELQSVLRSPESRRLGEAFAQEVFGLGELTGLHELRDRLGLIGYGRCRGWSLGSGFVFGVVVGFGAGSALGGNVAIGGVVAGFGRARTVGVGAD